jgi:hypothetical protein
VSKPATKKELLAEVEATLIRLRHGYIDPSHPQCLRDSQMRDCMWKRLGEITALDDVRMILNGTRNTFIC